jgi:hypothetical protein
MLKFQVAVVVAVAARGQVSLSEVHILVVQCIKFHIESLLDLDKFSGVPKLLLLFG